ncbi:MAG: glutamate 5-kinase [Candidatus Omnitrophica bacterium]|nr:glutamate 5-kinase [Candidatus Omnitrophota bacterium]
MRERLKSAQRIVVKAGTSILTSRQGRFSVSHLNRLSTEILELIRRKKEVLLVSSGAIAYGMEANRLQKRPKELAQLQALAAIGQGKLMHAYESFFSRRDILTAQVLLTRDALESRDRFLKARQTLETLMDMKDAHSMMRVLPVVNENDTVATEEIHFGDNDILAVHVAHLIHADLLVILSDVDGFYLTDGSRLRQVSSEEEIDQELVKHLKDSRRQTTVGGMKAKLAAARTAMRLGIPLLMVNGHVRGMLAKAIAGEDIGTLFATCRAEKNARKKWIAFSAARRGTLTVDPGAYKALTEGHRSLLPRGMVKVRGRFEKGHVVELETMDGKVFGRGVVRYSSLELIQLTGKKTDEIQGLLGYKSCDEVIHRNDMVIWD